MKYFTLKNEYVRIECLHHIQNIDITDKLLEVVIRPFDKKRSNAQNRLMFMWIDDIRSWAGNTKDEMHDILRAKFLPIIVKQVDGINLVELTSTADLKVKGFIAYLEDIESFAIENDVILRYPDFYGFAMGGKI